MYCWSYVQKLPNVAEIRGSRPIGNISGGSLGSSSWTQFTYFDLIGPAYDSYIRARNRGKSKRSEGYRRQALASCFAKLYWQIPGTAINVLAVLVRVGNQLSRSLPQFMVEYIETRRISFNLHSPSHLKFRFPTNRKKNPNH